MYIQNIFANCPEFIMALVYNLAKIICLYVAIITVGLGWWYVK